MSEVEQAGNGLTVEELMALLQEQSDKGYESWNVRLRVDKGMPAIGRSHAVSVEGVEAGFDWNKDTIFLKTSEPLGLAGEATERLKKTMMTQSGALYSIGRVLKDDRFSSEEKLAQIAQWVEHVFPPRSPKQGG